MSKEASGLRLYLDSVDIKDWQTYLPMGLFYGVTTNPKLLAASGIKFEVSQMAELAKSGFSMGANEIHLQVWGHEADQMVKIGRELAAIDHQVMVKVPITPSGILCASKLIAEDVQVTLTALHSAQQAILAVGMGAYYAAPYLGRMVDGGINGVEEVISMHKIVTAMESPLRLLIASIRDIKDLVTLAQGGLNTFTLLPSLVDDLLKNDLTDLAAASFQKAVEGN
jgi:transaldolase